MNANKISKTSPSSILTEYQLQMKVNSLKDETKVKSVDAITQVMDKTLNEEELRARIKDINVLIEKQLELKYEKKDQSFLVQLRDKLTGEIIKEISPVKLMNEQIELGILLDESY